MEKVAVWAGVQGGDAFTAEGRQQQQAHNKRNKGGRGQECVFICQLRNALLSFAFRLWHLLLWHIMKCNNKAAAGAGTLS